MNLPSVKKYEKRLNVYQRMLNIGSTDSLLDLGCGSGILIKKFKRNCLKVTGVDISEKALKIASRINPDCDFLKKDILELDLPRKSFDVVSCFEVLQYIQDQQLVFKKMFQIARRSVVISVPNYDSIRAQITKVNQALFGVGNYPDSPTSKWFKQSQLNNIRNFKCELHSFVTKMGKGFLGTIKFHFTKILSHNLYIVARFDL